MNLNAQDYLFPVKPGQRNFLSGNFSEIRPNHFHSGIDIKIGGIDGEPIRVIADGYVYRIKVSSFGYGNVLYVNHYNGQSSVYAHLQKFSDRISTYMRHEMYSERQNDLEVYVDERSLLVKRGEIIGNGGNTGSSAGSHLHFEIRDSLDRAIDPFLFDFNKEVVDNLPPIIYKIALRPLDYESRVEGRFERKEYTPILEGGKYILPNDIKISGRVGLEIYAVDKQDNVNNIFGIPVYEFFENGKPIFRINVDRIDFNKGRFLLTHTYLNRFVRLYAHPNNPLDLYQIDSISQGQISARNGEQKSLQINLKDFFGNTRVMTLNVIGEASDFQRNFAKADNTPTRVKYVREVMTINTKFSSEGDLAKIFVGDKIMEIPPAYEEKGRRIYLWDMNYGIPDSLDLCTEMIYPEVLTKIPFGEKLYFTDGNVSLEFEENTLLDDLFLRIAKSKNQKTIGLSIHPSDDYLQQNLGVRIHQTNYQGNKDKAHVYSVGVNGRKSFLGGTWENDDIEFKTRNFGTFVIESDEISPRISPIRISSDEIRFKISDDKSGIKDFEAFVNGEWVLMRYEHKQAVIWSEKSDRRPFEGDVLLKVRDMAGNESTWSGIIK